MHVTDNEFKNSTDVKKFDYLLGMSFWMLTEERKNELLRQRDSKLADLETLKRKTPSCLWKEDLKEFLEKLDVIEEKERKEEGAINPKETKKGGLVKNPDRRNKFRIYVSPFCFPGEEESGGRDAFPERSTGGPDD